MDKRILGENLRVSAVGLGCMGFSHAYGTATDRATAVKAIREAADMGCTLTWFWECHQVVFLGENRLKLVTVGAALAESGRLSGLIHSIINPEQDTPRQTNCFRNLLDWRT